jgi:hypothetical protein
LRPATVPFPGLLDAQLALTPPSMTQTQELLGDYPTRTGASDAPFLVNRYCTKPPVRNS